MGASSGLHDSERVLKSTEEISSDNSLFFQWANLADPASV